MMKKRNPAAPSPLKRIFYLIITVIFLGIEVLIARYVHDDFIRPYIGDVLVVFVVYAIVRIFMPVRCRLLPLYVFIFAFVVEILQRFHIVEVLGLSGNHFFSVLIGGVFEWKDVLCYGIGCIILGIYEGLVLKKDSKPILVKYM